MVDEDFVMGYVVGYNDGVGSGGGGGGSGIIIPEGTATIYDVPILRNYAFEGTEFGLGIIDVNNCPFLNNFEDSKCRWEQGVNMKTKEKFLLSYPEPYVSRRIGFAITKNNAVIGITDFGSYQLMKVGKQLYYTLVDGSQKLTHGDIVTGRIENQQIITKITETNTQYTQNITFEYDLVVTIKKYYTDTSKSKTATADDGNKYDYYDESVLDVYQGTETTTVHQSHAVGGMTKLKSSYMYLSYPDGLADIYQMKMLQFPVDWGTTAENIRDFHLGLTTGLSG